MAYNLNTLTVRKNEVIKADKIQFIIDNIRKLKSDISSIKTKINSLEGDIGDVSSSVGNINLQDIYDRLDNCMPKLTSSRTFDINWHSSMSKALPRLPSGGTWFCSIIYLGISLSQEKITEFGYDSTLRSGGWQIPNRIYGQEHVQIEGFAFRVD